ncbi:hypothetical protein CspeluHIS016_0500230 [Cutaneotrichosporon spelunceum]|uniref:Uncharacterized protein n=1 Tax=Cutaneotrichosporon spelunceum TaxID=1672016 RepID=A0AAD3TWQ2_9TREE|nr:hypothetical protein CspeluHIS016_0500230 [Cutaneotrichosporon spelunceum]
MAVKADTPPTPDDTPEPTDHSDEGHPSVSSCSSGKRPAAEVIVRCTYALTHPERPCPATAIESLLLMQDNGIPAIDILRMIRGLMGLPPALGDPMLPAPFRTPATSPDKATGARKWEPATPASKTCSPAAKLKAAPKAEPDTARAASTYVAEPASPTPTTASAPPVSSAPVSSPPTLAPPSLSPPAQASVQAASHAQAPAEPTPAPTQPSGPAENARLAAFLNLNANSTSHNPGPPALPKATSIPPVSRSGNANRRASIPAPPSSMPPALKDGSQSRSQSRNGSRRISFESDRVVPDKRHDSFKPGNKDFLPDGDRHGTSRVDLHRRSTDEGTRPELKHKASLIVDTTVREDDFEADSEPSNGTSGVLSRVRPRIQWTSFLPPLAQTLASPESFSTGVATGRLFGEIHTRLGERRMATPMLLLAGAFLSAVGNDATGSRLSALRLDQALSAAAMIEGFLQSAMLAELTAPVSEAPLSNFAGKFAEARGTAVSAHTRVRSNVNVLRDVLNRHLMTTVQRHSSKLAQEVFAPEPKIMDVLERTRSTCVRAGLTLTLWRAIALAYLAEVYVAVLHHLLKLRNDGYTAGHRQAYQRVLESLNTIDTWAKRQDVRINLAGVIRTFLSELITPSPTVSPIVSALDRVRSEHAGGHSQALAILRLAGLPDREIRALDKIAFAIEDAVERSNASSRDLPNGELVNKAVVWSEFE